jgi:hypothetical protein
MFVAPNGVTLTGQVSRGDGTAVVYGNLLSGTGNFVEGPPNVDTYGDWESLTATDYYLSGGAGGGGGGGAGQLTYVPSITSINPTSGPATGGTSVTITGTHLGDTTQVYFGATPAASFTIVSETSITAVSPAGTPGTVDITAGNATGTSGTSPADQFTYTGSFAPQLARLQAGTSTVVADPISSASNAGKTDALPIWILDGNPFLAPFLTGDLAPQGGLNQTQLEQVLPRLGHLDQHALDAVFAELAMNPGTPSLYSSHLSTL